MSVHRECSCLAIGDNHKSHTRRRSLLPCSYPGSPDWAEQTSAEGGNPEGQRNKRGMSWCFKISNDPGMITKRLHLRQTSAGQVQLGLRSGWQSAKSKAQSASTLNLLAAGRSKTGTVIIRLKNSVTTIRM